MTLFIDTSALVKRYQLEDGSDTVIAAMAQDQRWVVSALARAEATIAVCSVLEGAARDALLDRLAADLDRCLVVPVDHECIARATEIGCAHRVRTLDAIHLAAADRLPRPLSFLSFDARQVEAARDLGHAVFAI